MANGDEILEVNNANVNLFKHKLNDFHKMYKSKIQEDYFSSVVRQSWEMLNSGEDKKKTDGKGILADLFGKILKDAFDVEKKASYEENRLPEYTEIIKSSNELLRSAMFAHTDLYHTPGKESLFDSTAFGGLNENEMAEFINGESLWDMDQRSDEAWELQSREAKNIADKWSSTDKPYETMINEMKALIEADKKGTIGRKEVFMKLAAAEWMLVNNDKMMVDNPDDPINKIPNWGNRYWKTLTQTRESLGIMKHISMRDLIQGNYEEAAKAAISKEYNVMQISENVTSSKARAACDSMEAQKAQFATQSAAILISAPPKDKTDDRVLDGEENTVRKREIVHSEDERQNMMNSPKVWSNMVVEAHKNLEFTASRGGKI